MVNSTKNQPASPVSNSEADTRSPQPAHSEPGTPLPPQSSGVGMPDVPQAPSAPGGSESTVYQKPSGVEQTVASQAAEPSIPSNSVRPSQTWPPPKKGLPKNLLLIAGLVLLLGIFALVASKLISRGPGLVGKKGEIVWWGLQLDEAAVASLIKDYQEDNPDVKITYIKQSSQDYRERLTNALAKGEGPDIFRIHNSWVPMFSGELDTLPGGVMSQTEFSQIFYPIIVSDLTLKEGIVGIPLGYDAITLYINEDIFASAAKTPPKTWDELRNLAKELTQKDEDNVIIQSGVALGMTENVDHWQEILGLMMFQNGVNLAKPSGRLAEDALKFYSVFSKVDRVWDSTLPASTLAFANGKVAMYFGPSFRANEINKVNPNLRFKTVSLAQIRKDDPGQPDVSYATYWVEGVWARSTNKDVAWDFLKFLSQRESLEKLYEGVSDTRLVGEPYPRLDMAFLLREHPIVGSVIGLAPEAKSWYLADETFDGPTGINSQINALFAEAVKLGTRPREALEKIVVPGVAQILAQYGIRVR